MLVSKSVGGILANTRKSLLWVSVNCRHSAGTIEATLRNIHTLVQRDVHLTNGCC